MTRSRTRSSTDTPARARLAGLTVIGLALAGLGGCAGFTPMYATSGVSPKLSSISVAPIDGRLGFFVRQYLNDSLAHDGREPDQYRLTLANRELRTPRGITIANVASRYEVDLTSKYALTEIRTGKLVTKGQITVNVTYDVAAQPYAALAAEQDGERRAAEQAADRIRIELASFFASPRPLPADAAEAPLEGSTFSIEHTAAEIQSPRQQATGTLNSNGGQTDVFGQTRQTVATPDQAQPFDASQDPNTTAIKTLPDAGGAAQ